MTAVSSAAVKAVKRELPKAAPKAALSAVGSAGWLAVSTALSLAESWAAEMVSSTAAHWAEQRDAKTVLRRVDPKVEPSAVAWVGLLAVEKGVRRAAHLDGPKVVQMAPQTAKKKVVTMAALLAEPTAA